MNTTRRWRRALPFLNWPRPDRALLRGELLAGITVGLMIVPQGVAYAALAGMPLVTGLPRVAAWRRALAARPSVRAAVAADDPERLRDFIVRRGGWLGRHFAAPVSR